MNLRERHFAVLLLAIAQSERVHILVDDEQMLESVAGRREFSDTGILKGNEYDLRAAAGGDLIIQDNNRYKSER